MIGYGGSAAHCQHQVICRRIPSEVAKVERSPNILSQHQIRESARSQLLIDRNSELSKSCSGLEPVSVSSLFIHSTSIY